LGSGVPPEFDERQIAYRVRIGNLKSGLLVTDPLSQHQGLEEGPLMQQALEIMGIVFPRFFCLCEDVGEIAPLLLLDAFTASKSTTRNKLHWESETAELERQLGFRSDRSAGRTPSGSFQGLPLPPSANPLWQMFLLKLQTDRVVLRINEIGQPVRHAHDKKNCGVASD
jgi:hypothetical protein